MRKLNSKDLKELNFLKHYRIIRKWACKTCDLKDADLELLIYLDAIEFFTKVIELDNTFLLAYHARAHLYDITKQKDKAISDWKHCLMLNPSYIPALQALSK